MPFQHMQYVVTQGFTHVLPLSIADPSKQEDIDAALFPYPDYEAILLPEQFEQWRTTVRAHPHPNHWFGMNEQKELFFVGEYADKQEAAMAAGGNKTNNVIPRSVLNWIKAQVWAG